MMFNVDRFAASVDVVAWSACACSMSFNLAAISQSYVQQDAGVFVILYIVDPRDENVCISIGLAQAAYVFHWCLRVRTSVIPYIVEPRIGNMCISIGLAHAACVFRWF